MTKPSLKTVVVAMDGTSGSGKSSTSRGVAQRLGLRYLDTGAQFRAMTLWMLQHGIDIADPSQIAGRCDEPVLLSGTDPVCPTITLAATDVSRDIRSAEVTAAVSPVSAVPAVRQRLLRLQREIIGSGGIVVEGRDIGSVVWPQAAVKIYLTASPEARAQRRTAQIGGTDVEAIQADLRRRDEYDSTRAAAPLVVPEGAAHIDSTGCTLDQVVDQIVRMVEGVVAP